MKAALSSEQKARLERATINGRIGLRQGKVSELTVILKLLPGGANRIRAALGTGSTNADKVGTLHDMRYAFFDNDTRILFATTYDTEWDPYIDDFATKVPDDLDVVFCNCEGWPGIRNPAVKDFVVKHQISGRRLVCRQSEYDSCRDATARATWQGVDELLYRYSRCGF